MMTSVENESRGVQRYANDALRTLKQVLEHGKEMYLPGTVPQRHRVAWGLLRLTFDHALAINSIFRQYGFALAGSAYALLRPMNETFKRGVWFAMCANDEETKTFLDHDELPDGKRLVTAIEKLPPFNSNPIFSEQFKRNWRIFHSFTHGGAKAAIAYTRGPGVGPAFTSDEVHNAIEHAETVGHGAIHAMCAVFGAYSPTDAQKTLSKLDATEHATKPSPSLTTGHNS